MSHLPHLPPTTVAGNIINNKSQIKEPTEAIQHIQNETSLAPQPIKFPPRDGWQLNTTADFPWYLERVVDGESNWRGTWLLEVKDIKAIDWEAVLAPPKGSCCSPGVGAGNGESYKQRRCAELSPSSAPDSGSSRPSKKGWQFSRTAEFPWRLEQVIQEDSQDPKNWRAMWILEVKDMQAMDWGTMRVPKGDGRGGGKYQRKSTKQLPFTPEMQAEPGGDLVFPVEGGQDDLMVWLGKP